MSVQIELGKEPEPTAAVVLDVLGILAARLQNDYAGEMANWTFLGRDVAEYLLSGRNSP